VTAHPCLFVTLTAPSFGAVHTRREKNGKVLPCHPQRDAKTCPHGQVMACTTRHGTDAACLGEPLCPDCYDYTGSVLFNAMAPELWRRFTEARRRFARTFGMTLKDLREQLVIFFAKVAEYQRRGVVHLHAVIRLDGPTGPIFHRRPGQPSTSWRKPHAVLRNALENAVREEVIHRNVAKLVKISPPKCKVNPDRCAG
jgi:hypothetical protein